MIHGRLIFLLEKKILKRINYFFVHEKVTKKKNTFLKQVKNA